MKRNFDAPILDLDDKPLPKSNEDKAPVTIRDVLEIALQAPPQGQGQSESLDEKTKLFGLLLRVHKGGVQEISSEEASLMKRKVAAVYPPLITGRVAEFLDTDPPVLEVVKESA